MIRILTENDRAVVLSFLSGEPSINLFIIGDIEAFGFQEEFQTLWGQFTEDGVLEGILLRFYESYIPYFTDPKFDISEFNNIIVSSTGRTMLSGKESVVRKFDKVLPAHNIKSTYFCELRNPDPLDHCDYPIPIKKAVEEDAERVHELINQIEEFQLADTVDKIKQKISTGTGRIYYIENENGEMVSIAQTAAENSKSAMVVGVATLPEYRCRGYMRMCLTKLCKDVMSEGRTLCLFYDNPKAGRIYHQLGFENIDNWAMVSMN